MAENLDNISVGIFGKDLPCPSENQKVPNKKFGFRIISFKGAS